MTALIATYQLDIPEANCGKIDAMAQAIANGQTIGTQNPHFVERLNDYAARVVTVSAPVAGAPSGMMRFHLEIAYPEQTVGSDIGMLFAVTFGKVSMSGPIRLIDLKIPEGIARHFGGPRLGMVGIRHRLNQPQGPLLMSIFKPCLGLSPQELADMMTTQAEAGVHWVKDDEVLSDWTLDDAKRRLNACLQAIETVRQRTGHQMLYALNLNGPAHELQARAQALKAEGATSFLFNYLCYGLPLLNTLRQEADLNLPILAHPALAGGFYGSPQHGIAPQVLFGTLPRLAGADAVIFPSPYGSVSLPLPDAQAVHSALVEPHADMLPSFGVPSAGITANLIPRAITDFGSDVIINAGTGIHDAPEGAYQAARNFLSGIQTHSNPLVQAS